MQKITDYLNSLFEKNEIIGFENCNKLGYIISEEIQKNKITVSDVLSVETTNGNLGKIIAGYNNFFQKTIMDLLWNEFIKNNKVEKESTFLYFLKRGFYNENWIRNYVKESDVSVEFKNEIYNSIVNFYSMTSIAEILKFDYWDIKIHDKIFQKDTELPFVVCNKSRMYKYLPKVNKIKFTEKVNFFKAKYADKSPSDFSSEFNAKTIYSIMFGLEKDILLFLKAVSINKKNTDLKLLIENEFLEKVIIKTANFKIIKLFNINNDSDIQRSVINTNPKKKFLVTTIKNYIDILKKELFNFEKNEQLNSIFNDFLVDLKKERFNFYFPFKGDGFEHFYKNKNTPRALDLNTSFVSYDSLYEFNLKNKMVINFLMLLEKENNLFFNEITLQNKIDLLYGMYKLNTLNQKYSKLSMTIEQLFVEDKSLLNLLSKNQTEKKEILLNVIDLSLDEKHIKNIKNILEKENYGSLFEIKNNFLSISLTELLLKEKIEINDVVFQKLKTLDKIILDKFNIYDFDKNVNVLLLNYDLNRSVPIGTKIKSNKI